jgi:hypothetical protein
MNHVGYHWTISPSDTAWLWYICERDNGRLVLQGEAPSRAVAAALVVRALARGVTGPVETRSLAA